MKNNTQKSSSFSFTYSAKEQAELKRIRAKYTAPTEAEDKMARLRRLDASVTKAAETVSLILGIIGTLILGFGMSLCMTELGEILGFHKTASMVIGVTVGCFGGVIAGLAYPVYNVTVNRKRKKVAPEIVRLADELLK